MCLTLPEILPTGYLYLSRRKDVNTFEFRRGISSVSKQFADEAQSLNEAQDCWKESQETPDNRALVMKMEGTVNPYRGGAAGKSGSPAPG
jgi:hypothetical protein